MAKIVNWFENVVGFVCGTKVSVSTLVSLQVVHGCLYVICMTDTGGACVSGLVTGDVIWLLGQVLVLTYL